MNLQCGGFVIRELPHPLGEGWGEGAKLSRRVYFLFLPLPLGEGWVRERSFSRRVYFLFLPLPLGEGWGEGAKL